MARGPKAFWSCGWCAIRCKTIRTSCNAIQTLLQSNSNNYIDPSKSIAAVLCKIAVGWAPSAPQNSAEPRAKELRASSLQPSDISSTP